MALYDAEQLKQLMADDVKKSRSINNYEEGTVKWQRKNLQILADYLWDLPEDYEHFDMRHYAYDKRDDMTIPFPSAFTKPECNTVGCAVGHGPSAGIKTYPSERWAGYCERVFGIEPFNRAFNRLFHTDWNCFDNTSKGAAKRIYEYLECDIFCDTHSLTYDNQQPCRSL